VCGGRAGPTDLDRGIGSAILRSVICSNIKIELRPQINQGIMFLTRSMMDVMRIQLLY